MSFLERNSGTLLKLEKKNVHKLFNYLLNGYKESKEVKLVASYKFMHGTHQVSEHSQDLVRGSKLKKIFYKIKVKGFILPHNINVNRIYLISKGPDSTIKQVSLRGKGPD